MSLGKAFYFINSTYIGMAISVGLALYTSGKYARMAVQIAV